jgi:hypothetical protein
MVARANRSRRASCFAEVMARAVRALGAPAERPAHILLALARRRTALDRGRLELFLARVKNEMSPMNSRRMPSFQEPEPRGALIISLQSFIRSSTEAEAMRGSYLAHPDEMTSSVSKVAGIHRQSSMGNRQWAIGSARQSATRTSRRVAGTLECGSLLPL